MAFTIILREDCKHIRLSKIDHLVTKSVLTQASKLHSLWGNQPSLLLKVLLLLFCYLLLATLCHCIFTVSFDREFILYCIGTPHIKCIRILQHLLFTHTFKNYLHPSRLLSVVTVLQHQHYNTKTLQHCNTMTQHYKTELYCKIINLALFSRKLPILWLETNKQVQYTYQQNLEFMYVYDYISIKSENFRYFYW